MDYWRSKIWRFPLCSNPPFPRYQRPTTPSPDKHKLFQSPNHDMAVCSSAYTKSYMKHRPLRFVFITVMTEFSLKVMKYLQTLRPYHDPVCMVWQVHVWAFCLNSFCVHQICSIACGSTMPNKRFSPWLVWE